MQINIEPDSSYLFRLYNLRGFTDTLEAILCRGERRPGKPASAAPVSSAGDDRGAEAGHCRRTQGDEGDRAMSTMKARKQARDNKLDFWTALERLHCTGSRLMVMTGRTGDEFYVVPGSRIGRGGQVERAAAELIIARADVIKFDDGLFPGNPQSWKMVR
jgi:hypothetical protein